MKFLWEKCVCRVIGGKNTNRKLVNCKPLTVAFLKTNTAHFKTFFWLLYLNFYLIYSNFYGICARGSINT